MRILIRKLRLACAYKARALCNGIFVSGLDPRRLSREDCGYNPFFHSARARVDRQRRSVSCSLFGTGLFRETAVHVDGVGAVLLTGITEESVRAWPPPGTTVAERHQAPAAPSGPPLTREPPWPEPQTIAPPARTAAIDVRRVEAAVGRLFDDRGRHNPLRTRAVVVVQDGRIVCERYAAGIGPDTRLLSWSMAKSFVSVLVGILAGQGRIRVDEPAPVPEWSDPRDPRHAITVSHLLRMSAGLAWTETYGEKPISDVTRMLYFEPDMARFAASQPLTAPPDTGFRYSSGSINIVCRIIRDLFASREEYLAFPHRALFDRIGMRSAAWTTDVAGTLVGSSFLFATARDYARFGMFCLADGIWRGERILPEGWMRWATTPTPTDPSAEYGAGFWLNRDPADASKGRAYPKLPADFFYANGHQGQMIGVLPSRNLVVVRLGMTWGSEWGREDFLAELLSS
jgi:CubicO group peptidase (beta-lactamase class C family)